MSRARSVACGAGWADKDYGRSREGVKIMGGAEKGVKIMGGAEKG